MFTSILAAAASCELPVGFMYHDKARVGYVQEVSQNPTRPTFLLESQDPEEFGQLKRFYIDETKSLILL